MDDGQTLRSMVRDDAYHVERVLAEGPSGKTELVTLDGEGPLVRKRIPTELANAAAWAAAMEADEPLLPRIESLYSMPDELVVVYDYVPGETLEALVKERGPMDAAAAAGVMMDLCKAVSALHERGVVHRDITPANVVVSSDGAHLVDLGIARQHRTDRRHDTTTLGTWGFAAPEQYGFAQTDARSDVYSLGRLLGYLLTSEKPGGDEYDRAISDPGIVDVRMSEVVARATAFEPSARYQSAAELAEALRAIANEVPRRQVQQTPVPPREVSAPTARAATPEPSSAETGSSPALQQGPTHKPRLLPLAWATWTVLAAISLFLIFVAISCALNPIPSWGWAQNVMVAIVVGACAAAGVEVYRAVYQQPPYAGNPRPARLLLKRLLAVLGIACVLFFLLVVVYAIVTPVE